MATTGVVCSAAHEATALPLDVSTCLLHVCSDNQMRPTMATRHGPHVLGYAAADYFLRDDIGAALRVLSHLVAPEYLAFWAFAKHLLEHEGVEGNEGMKTARQLWEQARKLYPDGADIKGMTAPPNKLPCKKEHTSRRYVSTGGCVECAAMRYQKCSTAA